MMSSNLSPI